MVLDYESLLSGVPIFVDGIGTFRPTKLKELNPPPQGVGMRAYNLYLSILSWEKEDFLQHIPESQAAILSKNEKLNLFDMMAVLKDGFREILEQALAFFLIEKVVWDKSKNAFLVFRDAQVGEPADIDGYVLVGKINRDNFSDVRDLILQLNYMRKPSPPKFSNEKARQAWEKAKQYRKDAGKKENKRYTFGNIVSKVSTSGRGYTLLNIWDLTVYQLYNTFQEICHAKMSDLNLAAIANHGTEKNFDFQSFLDPVEK